MIRLAPVALALALAQLWTAAAPAQSWRPPPRPGQFSSTGFAGPSLQGMASEFFRAPESRGERILACRFGPETAACAADTANQFCRARGYVGAAFSRMETVRNRTFLADVLCSRTGG